MEHRENNDWGSPLSVRFPNIRWEITLKKALFRQIGARREFALRYDPQRPFPLPELFCFARCVLIGEERYIIYAFDGKDAPIF